MESFNARLRDELLNVEVSTCFDEAQVLAADWWEDHNANHPHRAILNKDQALLSHGVDR